MPYKPIIEGVEDGYSEWQQPVSELNGNPPGTKYKMSCCDCHLVHDVQFRIHEGKIQLRARRNARATGQLRRWWPLWFQKDRRK